MMWLQVMGLMMVSTSVMAGRESYERIGYFWHITDIHYDGHVNFHGDAKRGCWRPEYEGTPNSKSKSSRRPMGRYGDYSCDSTWELIESASRMMMSRQPDNVEFVLWTGDGLSHAARHLPEAKQIELLENLTDLLRKTFSSQFVFPALGHDDPSRLKELVNMWARWLPYDSMKTFETGGYYIIERKLLKLQIVVLNTNLMRRVGNDEEATKQWYWLEAVLQKFQRNGETVYLVGHMAPGSNERHRAGQPPSNSGYGDRHNNRYLKIVRKYASIIAGQFFGHLHSDTFRVIYGENGRPISWAMLAPSINPKRSADGPNNPGLRLYKFDKDTGQVFDYTQYYLDLSAANSAAASDEGRNPTMADWQVEYNFSTYYSINEINAVNLHSLADKLSQPTVFNRYYRANSVRFNANSSPGCDSGCALHHYCAITRVDYAEFDQCLQTAASALSASRTEATRSLLRLVVVMNAALIAMMRW